MLAYAKKDEHDRSSNTECTLVRQPKRVRVRSKPASGHAASCHRHLEANKEHVTCRPTANSDHLSAPSHVPKSRNCALLSTEECLTPRFRNHSKRLPSEGNPANEGLCSSKLEQEISQHLSGDIKDSDADYARLRGVRQDAPSPPVIGSCTLSSARACPHNRPRTRARKRFAVPSMPTRLHREEVFARRRVGRRNVAEASSAEQANDKKI